MKPGGGAEAAGDGAIDVGALVRSRSYRRLLVIASLIGVVISLACWAFLELIHAAETWVYTDLPKGLGFDTAPWWWPIPVLAIAGLVIAFAIVRLPGHGGHEPSEGLKSGPPTTPIELPGVLLAALASIALGVVLGPEAPLIALGTGLALYLVGLSRRPVPDQGKMILAAAGSFAAIATIFGSPVVGAVIIIEAAGIGGPTLPLVLLPGLMSAGIGSLVFVGIGSITGLSSNAYAIPPLSLPAYPHLQVSDFLWTIPVALVAAAVTFGIVEVGRRTRTVVAARPFLFTVACTLVIAGLAIAFAQITGSSVQAVLFSGQDSMNALASHAATLAVGTVALLIVCKGLAWGISLGSARGGPTFPAVFLGLAGGLLASHLPGFHETPAVGVLVGAMVVSVLRLPLSAVVLALLVTQVGSASAPLVIVGVTAAYIATQLLEGTRRGNLPRRERVSAAQSAETGAAP